MLLSLGIGVIRAAVVAEVPAIAVAAAAGVRADLVVALSVQTMPALPCVSRGSQQLAPSVAASGCREIAGQESPNY